MNKTKASQNLKLNTLKSKLNDFDLALPGRLRIIYSKCGKQNCACQTDESARHGPYWLWDRKVNGKLSSKMVTKAMAVQLKKWIENRKVLENILQNIYVQSEKIAADLVDKTRKSEVTKL